MFKQTLFLFLLSISSLSAVNFNDLKEKYADESQSAASSFVLPLSYDVDPALLLIPIPKTFILGRDASAFPDVVYLEFVCRDGEFAPMSETITLCQTAEVLDAHLFIKGTRTAIEKTQALHSDANFASFIACKIEQGIRVGFYLGQRPYLKPQQLGIQAPIYDEILAIKSIQGEDRVWVIQYSIQYNPELTSEGELDAFLDRIEAFFETCKITSTLTPSPI